ncbi:MAG TPA: RNA 2',3'-cyclic phosphodiesterase [bacterium]|nr:RNA 2',3'-cyclic phosphodiesterase [bacterium]
MDTIRAFIAVKLDPQLQKALGELQRQLKRGGAGMKWVEPENIHLTIKFLGDVPADRIDEVKTAVAGVAARSGGIDMSFANIGVFPDLRRPRVVWAGVEQGKEELGRLAEDIEAACGALGFAKEERPFVSHVTIARVKELGSPQRFLESLRPHQGKEFGRMRATRLSLIKSTLTPNGPKYDTIADACFSDV